MEKKQFIYPLIEVIKLEDDIIRTSQAPYDPFDPYPDDDDPGFDPFSI